MIRVPSKKTGPPESPLHEPPLPFDGLFAVMSWNFVSGFVSLIR
jgi:hypothetical protein